VGRSRDRIQIDGNGQGRACDFCLRIRLSGRSQIHGPCVQQDRRLQRQNAQSSRRTSRKFPGRRQERRTRGRSSGHILLRSRPLARKPRGLLSIVRRRNHHEKSDCRLSIAATTLARSAPTRFMMCASSSTICATSTSRHTSPRTRPTAAPRSTRARRATPATRSVSRSASKPRSRSAARPADAARRRALAVQIHSDYGSLRPHPATQIDGGVCMTSGKVNPPRPIQTPQLGSISCYRAAQRRIQRPAKAAEPTHWPPPPPATRNAATPPIPCSHRSCGQRLSRSLTPGPVPPPRNSIPASSRAFCNASIVDLLASEPFSILVTVLAATPAF
jgi:hypothetical protein